MLINEISALGARPADPMVAWRKAARFAGLSKLKSEQKTITGNLADLNKFSTDLNAFKTSLQSVADNLKPRFSNVRTFETTQTSVVLGSVAKVFENKLRLSTIGELKTGDAVNLAGSGLTSDKATKGKDKSTVDLTATYYVNVLSHNDIRLYTTKDGAINDDAKLRVTFDTEKDGEVLANLKQTKEERREVIRSVRDGYMDTPELRSARKDVTAKQRDLRMNSVPGSGAALRSVGTSDEVTTNRSIHTIARLVDSVVPAAIAETKNFVEQLDARIAVLDSVQQNTTEKLKHGATAADRIQAQFKFLRGLKSLESVREQVNGVSITGR